MNAFATELRRRATTRLRESELIVNYYRIRRKLSFPWPLAELPRPSFPVPIPGLAEYPWSIWLIWEIEERITALGYSAELFGNEEPWSAAAVAADRDLAALARWPSYRQLPHPDLLLGHCGRLLWTATTQWHWLEEPLRQALLAAQHRLVDDAAPLIEKRFGHLSSCRDVLDSPDPYGLLQNIPFIGTLGTALAARATGHPATTALDSWLFVLVGALLDIRAHGFTEGVAYDGYVLDFVVPWIAGLDAEERRKLLTHPKLEEFFDESCQLATPGAVAEPPELGDVEPQEMPFHASAQAKLQQILPRPDREWWLRRCGPNILRSDALAVLAAPDAAGAPCSAVQPQTRAFDARSAVVLRTGWEESDTAVFIGASNSPMGHIHCDYGSIILASAGRRLISDPGYQQYMARSEREFTLGPSAHNAPVIGGRAPDRKSGCRLGLDELEPGLLRAGFEIAGCYPPELGLDSVRRTVWLRAPGLVVVADAVRSATTQSLTYHWHGHPEAAWRVAGGWAALSLSGIRLWFSSPQCAIAETSVDRLRGSRGQLTLTASTDSARPAVWWVFAIGERPPAIDNLLGGAGLRVEGAEFRCP